MLQGEQGLDQARAARRRQQMPDIRFDCAQHALPGTPFTPVPQTRQTLKLDRITHRRAGGMAFDQVHHVRCPAGLCIGCVQGAQLPLGTRREQIAFDVVRDAGAANQGKDVVAIAQGVVETLQHHDAGAFADDQAVALDVKRRTAPRRRQRAQLREAHLRVKRIGPRQPARQHHIGAALQQFVAGQFDGIE